MSDNQLILVQGLCAPSYLLPPPRRNVLMNMGLGCTPTAACFTPAPAPALPALPHAYVALRPISAWHTHARLRRPHASHMCTLRNIFRP